MTPRDVDGYVRELAAELRRHGIVDAGILEEVRGHLSDARDEGARRGLPPEAAWQDALSRFGTPGSVARTFAADRFRRVNAVLLAAAVIAGLAIAYVDSRPTWDDTGITAFSMLAAAGILGLIGPRRPWLWALGVGIWIPLHAIAAAPTPGSFAMLIVLAFPLAGAYAGTLLRRMAAA